MHLDKITVTIDDIEVVKNLSLHIPAGQIHALMGPNGSGKSSLAYALAGHPYYRISAGIFIFNNQVMTTVSPENRARAGIFLAHQHPVALPGVSIMNFLTETYRALVCSNISIEQVRPLFIDALAQLGLPAEFLHRAVHDNLSGGEKKRLEMVQALLFKPSLMILDEIDSGLDIDALALIKNGIQKIRQENGQTRILIITHYPRILQYLVPDKIHLIHKGTLLLSGNADLVNHIEKHGYNFQQLREFA